MNRRNFLRTTALTAGAVGLGRLALAESKPAKAAAKPNVLVIICDDAGYADFSMHGSKQFPTPNIDAIAKAGVRFSNGYVTASVCSPSRAGLITGRYQQRFGHIDNMGSSSPGDDPKAKGLRLDQITIADAMKSVGYRTIALGKWHLGYDDECHPCSRGFTDFYGFRGGGSSYWANKCERGIGKIEKFDNYMTDQLGSEACKYIVDCKKKDQPFFMYLSPNAVHTPMHSKKDDLAKFDGIDGTKGRKILGGMTLGLDRMVGEVMACLKKQGLTDNTLVVFINDNGGTPLTNSSCNAPLNGMKGTLLEGGIRVPFAMQWPGNIPAATVYDKPVISLDIMATALAAAGVTNPQKLVDGLAVEREKIVRKLEKKLEIRVSCLPGNEKKRKREFSKRHCLDGVNLVPYVNGKTPDAPHDALYWMHQPAKVIREGDLKLLVLADRPPLLYNVKTDISEQTDLAAKHPDKVKAMMKKLFIWQMQTEYPLFNCEHYWFGNSIGLYDRKYILKQPK